MKKPINVENDRLYIHPDAVKGIEYNGTYIPKVKNIIFNTSTKKGADGNPYTSLGTCIIFADGTKSSVGSSELDQPSKELGIIYALAKRVLMPVGEKDRIQSEGFMGVVRRLIRKSEDQSEIRRQREEEKEFQRTENIKRQENAHRNAMKRKDGKLTIGQRMRSVETILAALADQIAKNSKIDIPVNKKVDVPVQDGDSRKKVSPKKSVKKVAKKHSRK